jgi:uncharacterized Zn finger protein (UPF0148 family)
MNDFRVALAQEVAAQIGAEVLPETCSICQHPLVMKPDQGLPFCWFCSTDKMAAQRGRTALTKAKMAANGVFLEIDLHPHPIASAADRPRSTWPEGWTL